MPLLFEQDGSKRSGGTESSQAFLLRDRFMFNSNQEDGENGPDLEATSKAISFVMPKEKTHQKMR